MNLIDLTDDNLIFISDDNQEAKFALTDVEGAAEWYAAHFTEDFSCCSGCDNPPEGFDFDAHYAKVVKSATEKYITRSFAEEASR